MPKDFHIPHFAGIHLAGVNSHRTAVVTMSGHPLKKTLKLSGLYEKIGHIGNLFSDDRLLEILRLGSPFDRVFVDSPISVPPCVACIRPVCPGVDACEDVHVAYMMSLAQKIGSRQKRRRRSLNPQVQRLWDVYRLSRSDPDYFEPTYTNNNASQAIRARSFQKRLSGMMPDIELEETSVPLSLVSLGELLDMDEQQLRDYRSFSNGLSVRSQVLERLIENHWTCHDERFDKIERSVDLFEAYITAFVAALVHFGLKENCPKDYVDNKEWVFRPMTSMEVPVG